MNNTTRLPLGSNSKALRSAVIPWVSLLLAPAWLACGSQASLPVENLGNTTDLHAEPTQPSATVTAAVGKARLNGHWTGLTKEPYMEVEGEPSNYIFPSGSRSVTLDLEFDEDSLISGSLVFGVGTPPPPQAGVAYPPGFEYGLGGIGGIHLPPVEGFSHVLSELTGTFATGANESAWLTFQEFAAFSGWCPLQPSLSIGTGRFNCLGGDGSGGGLSDEGPVCFRSENGTEEPVDCNMAALCSSGTPCDCNAAGCAQSNSEARITVELDGDELTLGFVGTEVLVPERGTKPLGPVTLSRTAHP
jgi:hypothetical protein